MKKTLLSLLLAVALLLPGGPRGAAQSGWSGRVFLPLVRGPLQVQPGGLTSSELIDQALSAGKIDAQAAAVYHYLALFEGSPLPALYRGVADPDADVAAVKGLLEVYAGLRPELKTLVLPYLVRPDDLRSRISARAGGAAAAGGAVAQGDRPPLSGGWKHVRTNLGVTVHYQESRPADEALAVGVRDAVDKRIFMKVLGLMDRLWADDLTCISSFSADHGGDSDLDIYLVHDITDNGVEVSCSLSNPTPGYILLNARRPLGDDNTKGIVQTAAHEIFHAVQDNYRYAEQVSKYLWIMEATAKWFEEYTYPNAQSEHARASSYMKSAKLPLEDKAGMRYYGVYLFPFYLNRVEGLDPGFVNTWFQNAGSFDSLKAVSAGLPGSDLLVDYFAEFSLRNLNLSPLDDYRQKDGLNSSLLDHITPEQVRNISGARVYSMAGSSGGQFPHLSAYTYHYVFSDQSARSVAFYNGINYKLKLAPGLLTTRDSETPYYQGDDLPVDYAKNMQVRAMVRIDGQWHEQDWSGMEYASFCRDARSERIQELVVQITNSSWEQGGPNFTYQAAGMAPRLVVSDVGCWRWEGTFTRTDTSDPGISDVTRGRLVLERSYEGVFPAQIYQIAGGSLTMNVNGYSQEDFVTYKLNGSLDLRPGDGDPYLALVTYNLVGDGPSTSAYYGQATADRDVQPCGTRTYEVDDGKTETVQWCAAPGTLIYTPFPGDGPLNKITGGRLIQGSYDLNGIHFEWRLEAQVEP